MAQAVSVSRAVEPEPALGFVGFLFVGRSGTKSTVTAAIYWPIVPVLDDRW
jgi:hypothetical protein